jgi:hypothetical protein
MTTGRAPCVGSGEDGCRRSAQVDREQADGLSWEDPRKEELHQSAERWEEQAYQLMLQRIGQRPTLAQLREQVGSEEWLAALALLDLSPAVANDAAGFTAWSRDSGRFTYTGEGEDRVGTFHPQPEMDWETWVAKVDSAGCGWSSTEMRLFELVAALTVVGRRVSLVGVLDRMGSWVREVLGVLVQWASGGNNREYPGRVGIQAQP